MRLPTRHIELFKHHGAEALRECGVLWIVFAVLDKVVAGTMTSPWMMWNFSVSIVLGLLGMYIETKRTQ